MNRLPFLHPLTTFLLVIAFICFALVATWPVGVVLTVWALIVQCQYVSRRREHRRGVAEKEQDRRIRHWRSL